MILIVDDEEAVRKMLVDLLQLLGYSAHTCESGEEGVAYYAENHADITVCIIDLRLPDMDGRQVFAAMREAHPHAKGILVSGYNPDDEIEAMTESPDCRFLQKPFPLPALKTAIDELSEQECRPAMDA